MGINSDISHKPDRVVKPIKSRIMTLVIFLACLITGIIISRSSVDPGLSATIQVLLLFVIMVVMIRENLSVEIALLTGSVLLGVFFRIKPSQFAVETLRGISEIDVLLILGIVFFITVLGTFMDRSGHMKSLMESLSELIRDARFVAGLAPALIGLMPMPGGALFSAPMVDSVGKPLGWSPARMAMINYWCRHVWEYIWPMYAGVLLSASLLKVDIPVIVRAQSPLTITSIVGSLVFLLLPIKRPVKNGIAHSLKYNLGGVWLALWPIVAVIVITFIPYPSAEALKIPQNILTSMKMLIVLVLATFLFAGINKITLKQVGQDFIACLRKHTIFIILTIMIFKHFIDYTDVAKLMAPYFSSLNLPPMVIVFILPFIVGMLTGITMAYVGICYPILIPFLISASGQVDLGLVQFAYAGGYFGVMLTPVHLCFVLTREYFKVDWGECYRLLLGPSVLLFIVSLIIALVW